MEGSPDDTPATDAADAPAEDRPVSVEIDIADGRTVITVTGDRDAAVVVTSAAGERIYLPPEDFRRPPESAAGRQDAYGTGPSTADSPYQSVSDSPYQSVTADSPYQSPGESDSPYQRGGPAPGRLVIPHQTGPTIKCRRPLPDTKVCQSVPGVNSRSSTISFPSTSGTARRSGPRAGAPRGPWNSSSAASSRWSVGSRRSSCTSLGGARRQGNLNDGPANNSQGADSRDDSTPDT